MEVETDEASFWQWSAAPAIFEHVKTADDLRGMPYGFDHATIDRALGRIFAFFSCVYASGSGRNEVCVRAERQLDGSWQVAHGPIKE